MKKVLAITIYDRTPEVIKAVCAGLSLPGNQPDAIAVCYDRAPAESMRALRSECIRLGIDLREEFLEDDAIGPRCPSLAWNKALSMCDESHVFCMSSEIVLAPHSIGMAYHMSKVAEDFMIVGKAEHCGQSYAYPSPDGTKLLCRTISWSGRPSGLGFVWLLPMKAFRTVGGFDEVYMNGYCYEDDDFVLRMWNNGTDFLFCDDIIGFHLEHKRDHLKDQDGKVSINENVFVKRFGDINLLREWKFNPSVSRFDVGLGVFAHERNNKFDQQCYRHQKFYGQDASWRAIPVGPNDFKASTIESKSLQ